MNPNCHRNRIYYQASGGSNTIEWFWYFETTGRLINQFQFLQLIWVRLFYLGNQKHKYYFKQDYYSMRTSSFGSYSVRTSYMWHLIVTGFRSYLNHRARVKSGWRICWGVRKRHGTLCSLSLRCLSHGLFRLWRGIKKVVMTSSRNKKLLTV